MGNLMRAAFMTAACAFAPVALAQDTDALSETQVRCFVTACDEAEASPVDASDAMPETGPRRNFHLTPGVKARQPASVARRPVRKSLDMRIQFELGSTELTAQARRSAQIFARALSSDVGSRVFIIEGHTDAIGGQAYNQKLSQDRAQAVADYLVGNGVAPGKIRAIGLGFSRPLDKRSATDPENRRVEIVRY